MSLFKVGVKYKDRSGDVHTVIAIDLPSSEPIVAYDKNGHPHTYYPDGRYLTDSGQYDLTPNEVKEPREFWVNVYDGYVGGLHEFKVNADRVAENGRKECIKVREVLDAE